MLWCMAGFKRRIKAPHGGVTDGQEGLTLDGGVCDVTHFVKLTGGPLDGKGREAMSKWCPGKERLAPGID